MQRSSAASAGHDYDIVIIGGGSAGLTAARVALSLGARVALVDKERLGGECLWTGCVPSKSLIASARVAYQTRRLADVGLQGSLGTVDLGAVMDRVQGVIETIDRGEDAAAMRKLGVDVRLGQARFRSPEALEVDGETLRGRAYLICTGSRAAVPPIEGLQGVDGVDYLTNETVFGLRELPEHLVVAGGGPNGVEMAQAFRRLGSRVTVLAGDRGLMSGEDREVADALHKVFAREGIAVVRAKLTGVRRDDAGVHVHYGGGEGGRGGDGGEVVGDRLLVALGRRPNVEGLGLEQAGVSYDTRHGIVVDPYLQTSAARIFACGDVTGPYRYTHAAGFQAATAVRNALLPRLRSRSRLAPMPWTTFTDPELARVGLTEDEARRAHGDKVLVLRSLFEHVDRAQAQGETEGFVKLIVSPWRGRILGGHILGPRAGELIGEVTLAMRKGLSVSDLAGTIHVYPTLAMAVQQAALDYRRQAPLARLLNRPLRALVRHSS